MTELSSEDKSSERWEHEKRSTHSTDLLDVGRTSNDDPFLIKKTKPYRIPPSSVLNEVKSFLPKMRNANCELQKRLKTIPQENLDIENIADCQQDVIEMNLAVFAEYGFSSDEGDDDSQSGDSSNSDIEVLSAFQEVSAANMKMPNKPQIFKRTIIEDLSERHSEIKEHVVGSEVKLEGEK